MLLRLLLCFSAGHLLFAGVVHAEWIPGFSQAKKDAHLAFPVAGIVAIWHFTEGDSIASGQVIAELDSGLESLEVQRRERLMESALREYERTKRIFDRGSVVSAEEVDAAASVYEVTVIEHRLALEQLERRKMRSPFSGILVSSFDIREGEAIERNQPVARLSDPSRCIFIAFVEAESASKLSIDGETLLRFPVRAGYIEASGTIVFISPVVDPASGLVEVKAEFSNRHAQIRPGLNGEIFFQELADE